MKLDKDQELTKGLAKEKVRCMPRFGGHLLSVLLPLVITPNTPPLLLFAIAVSLGRISLLLVAGMIPAVSVSEKYCNSFKPAAGVAAAAAPGVEAERSKAA